MGASIIQGSVVLDLSASGGLDFLFYFMRWAGF